MIYGKTIDELSVGEYTEKTHIVSDSEVQNYAEIVGDKNPIHLNDHFAAQTVFKKRIAHGMLIAGYISEVIGMELPGPGCIYVSQSLKFIAPVYLDDEITVRVQVEDVNIERNRITLQTTCMNQNGVTVIKGEALVLPRRK